MGFRWVTKTEILNQCYLRRLLFRARDTRLNDQLDKPKLRLHAFQYQRVYWGDKLTFAFWELAPNDHLKNSVTLNFTLHIRFLIKYCVKILCKQMLCWYSVLTNNVLINCSNECCLDIFSIEKNFGIVFGMEYFFTYFSESLYLNDKP